MGFDFSFLICRQTPLRIVQGWVSPICSILLMDTSWDCCHSSWYSWRYYSVTQTRIFSYMMTFSCSLSQCRRVQIGRCLLNNVQGLFKGLSPYKLTYTRIFFLYYIYKSILKFLRASTRLTKEFQQWLGRHLHLTYCSTSQFGLEFFVPVWVLS